MTTTNAGYAEVAELLIGAGTGFNNIAIGTGTTNFTTASTQLTNETKRDTATTSTVTTDITGDTSQFVNTFSFTGSFAITEAGVLNNKSGGDLIAAQTFSSVNVASGDSLEITYKIDID